MYNPDELFSIVLPKFKRMIGRIFLSVIVPASFIKMHVFLKDVNIEKILRRKVPLSVKGF